MAKRAAKELTKVDAVAIHSENFQPYEVREEFFQKYSVDALKEYLQMMDCQVSTQGRQFRKDKLSRLAFAFFQLYVEGDTD